MTPKVKTTRTEDVFPIQDIWHFLFFNKDFASMALLSFFPWLPTKEPKLVTHIVRHCQARTRKQICYFIEPVKSCTVMFFWAVLKNKKNLDCFHFLCIFTFKCDETPTISMKSYIKTSLVEQPIFVFPFFWCQSKIDCVFQTPHRHSFYWVWKKTSCAKPSCTKQ